MSAMTFWITRVSIFTELFVQAKIKENIKAPCHWPLWGDSVNSPHKKQVTQKMFPFDDVIMIFSLQDYTYRCAQVLDMIFPKTKTVLQMMFSWIQNLTFKYFLNIELGINAHQFR